MTAGPASNKHGESRAWWTSLLAQLRAAPIFWLGLAVIAVPSLHELATRGWSTDEGGHAPIIFAAVLWIVAREWPAARAVIAPPSLAAALATLLPALLLYLAARITGLFEVRSVALYLIVLALLYGTLGTRALRALLFPLLYAVFLLPIPETFIDIGTQPIKLAISQAVVGLLALFGLPVASTGVSIMIGPFELLIAAACAGLNSLITLTAIGLIYVHLKRDGDPVRTTLLVVAIFPIAVLANFIRVMILVLLTYYAGEAVAQGFMHEFAGLFMFMIALLLIIGLEQLLQKTVRPGRSVRQVLA